MEMRSSEDIRVNPETDQPLHPTSQSSARDHLANERTLLAWSRTGIAVIALGFVVARFGLLIRELNQQHVAASSHAVGISTWFGTGLVACGSAVLLLAMRRYLRVGRQIERGAYDWSPGLSSALAVILAGAGVLLAVYLLLTQ